MHKDGPMLVIAGPGSGKTTVLVNRVVYLTTVHNVDPSSVLVITFTKSAAFEMEERYLKLTKADYSRIRFGTFHSVFLELIKRYSNEYRKFSLVDERKAISLIGECVRELFPEDKNNYEICESYLNDISRIKNGLTANSENSYKINELYNRKMREFHFIDFDDMIIVLYDLLKNNEDILSKIRNQYRYILIDEFQDINSLQFKVSRLIAAPLNNLFAVGDDDQCVYSFRGSDPMIMLNFVKIYKDTRLIYLNDNFRSLKYITDASRQLIEHNKKRFKKNLRVYSNKVFSFSDFFPTFNKKVPVLSFFSENEEYMSIASLINKIPENESVAVLARTNRICLLFKSASESILKRKIDFMTFHGSKGLEFDNVFIIRANSGVTPYRSNTDNIEDERRMFYVAMTRAKKRLIISYTKTNAKGNGASVFLSQFCHKRSL